jgi:YVTN family beta-propeller protein
MVYTGVGIASVAVKPDDGSLVLTTDNGAGTVSVINTTFQPPAVVATIPVGGPGNGPFGIAIQDSITYNPSTGSTAVPGVPIGLTVTGADASLVGSVKWDLFANGKVVQTTSTLTTSYSYAAPGTFVARVTVLNKSGGTLLTKTVPVVVQSPLQAIRTAEGLTNLALSPSSLRTSLLNDLTGAYLALEVGNRSAALNDVNLYVNQLTSYVRSLATPSKTVTTALGQGEAIAAALKPPPPVLGAGQLMAPGGASEVGQPVTFTATWTVPNGTSWRSLQHVDLRLVAKKGDGDDDLLQVADARGGGNNATPLPIGLWARFNVGDPSTLLLLDDSENVVAGGELGSDRVLETSTAKLFLADSSFQGSGPTGPSVTVNFAVSFKPAAARGNAAQPYQTQLLASDVLQGVQGPDQIGHWTVRPVHHD